MTLLWVRLSQIFPRQDSAERTRRIRASLNETDALDCSTLSLSAGLSKSLESPDLLQRSGADRKLENDLLSEPELVYSYHGGGSFGELALLFNCPRAATVKCTKSGVLWAIGRRALCIWHGDSHAHPSSMLPCVIITGKPSGAFSCA